MVDRQPDLRARLLLGVGLTSAALMASEIALTRVLSVTVWYHFAFFAISVALLGTSVAALLVHVGQRRFRDMPTQRACALFALAQALTTLTFAVVLVRVTPDWFGGMAGAFTVITAKLALVFALAMGPFVCGGLVLALVTARHSQQVHRVYFADLLGAAVGCVLTIPLMSWVGGPRALASCASMALLAAVVFSAARTVVGTGRMQRNVAMGIGLLVVQLGIVAAPLLDLRAAKGIDLMRVVPELTRWNSFSLVSVFDAPGFRGWGLSPNYRGPVPPQKTLVIDMSALTSIARFDGDFSKVDYVTHDLSALVYRVVERPRKVCVIGAGGGKDVLSALAVGASHVTGVEINPLIVNDVMLGRYREFSGGLYARSDVHVQVEDGRSFLRRSTARYDVILISMVDTSAATAAGAYALTENGLYTTEAFEEFLERLAPGGVLTVSTVSLPGLAVGARLVATARAALVARGRDPQRCVAVVHTPWITGPTDDLYDVLIKPDGFSAAELNKLQASLTDLAFQPGFVPGRQISQKNAEDRSIARILDARNSAQLSQQLADLPIDVSAVHDDRPFFFYQNRFSDFVLAFLPLRTTHLFGNGLLVLARVLVLALLMLIACCVLPLAWLRRVELGSAQRLFPDLVYVSSLGLGFMCIEIAFVHRVTLFLGQPTYTLVTVLFVLLVTGGIGSRVLVTAVLARPRLRAWLFATIVLLLAATPWLSDLVFSLARAESLLSRAVAVALLMTPIGLLLGVPLPLGLGRIALRDAARVPWLWGVNGAASVLGSIMATLIALHAGTQATLLVGAGLYALAALVWSNIQRGDSGAKLAP